MFYLNEDIMLNMKPKDFKLKTLNFENLEFLYNKQAPLEEIEYFGTLNEDIVIFIDLKLFYYKIHEDYFTEKIKNKIQAKLKEK